MGLPCSGHRGFGYVRSGRGERCAFCQCVSVIMCARLAYASLTFCDHVSPPLNLCSSFCKKVEVVMDLVVVVLVMV